MKATNEQQTAASTRRTPEAVKRLYVARIIFNWSPVPARGGGVGVYSALSNINTNAQTHDEFEIVAR